MPFTWTPAQAEQARVDALREGLQECHAAATLAKERGNTRGWEEQRARAERLMLDYISNGYITRIHNEMIGLRP